MARLPPLTVTALPTASEPRSSVPPLTVMAPVPNAFALPATSVPALNVVPPMYALLPDSVSEPAPAFTMEPEPVIVPRPVTLAGAPA